MMYLKQHWKITLPVAVLMLCILVATSVVLSRPNEPRYQYFTTWLKWRGKERQLEEVRHAQIVKADQFIRDLGPLDSPQDVIDRFTKMTPEEASQREQSWQSWDRRNDDLNRRKEELARTKPTKPIPTHSH